MVSVLHCGSQVQAVKRGVGFEMAKQLLDKNIDFSEDREGDPGLA